jgi:hypothetical protein
VVAAAMEEDTASVTYDGNMIDTLMPVETRYVIQNDRNILPGKLYLIMSRIHGPFASFFKDSIHLMKMPAETRFRCINREEQINMQNKY